MGQDADPVSRCGHTICESSRRVKGSSSVLIQDAELHKDIPDMEHTSDVANEQANKPANLRRGGERAGLSGGGDELQVNM